MSPSVLRLVNWHSHPDQGEGAPPVLHQMICRTQGCEARSEPDTDFEAVRTWSLRHSGSNTDHREFLETIVRPWRNDPKGVA
ncbi:hypothetical protein HOS58_gp45 [Streptomyces phage Attoomi]|uniref:DUF7848 domain-containing protein n=1 Tax=Streptomyces phage Attoomi TaxID=2059881 RepID=A0A2H5BLI7_9CAUD|nr:hypothetical protein HOS58_gp45 [Streptomyces phage Attoomi]AUG87177.1 hypothetical protein SEA_ATTOOMI_45 [Streptomyces phage Attoomi]